MARRPARSRPRVVGPSRAHRPPDAGPAVRDRRDPPMSTASLLRRLIVALGFAALVLPVATASVAAHPLGNFTINHYTGIRVSPDALLVDRVIDRAEIPTFQARAAMDIDGDGTISDAEATDWREAACASDSEQLQVTAEGPLVLRVDASALGFPMGQGALTTRLVCRYSAVLPAAVTTAALSFRVDDRADDARIGWREIVVTGDATTIDDSDAPTASLSARLTSYPTD